MAAVKINRIVLLGVWVISNRLVGKMGLTAAQPELHNHSISLTLIRNYEWHAALQKYGEKKKRKKKKKKEREREMQTLLCKPLRGP